MKAGLGNIMQQAQKMQAELKKVQAELAEAEIEGQAGGGMVSIVMNGRHEVCQVHIDDALLTDKEMLEDLVAAAMNDAVHKLEDETSEQMSQVTSGLELPAGMKFPFS
ncbi:MAG: YbaB/EbfC family nucleoid-associated protein [Pseudomonadota bacterium]